MTGMKITALLILGLTMLAGCGGVPYSDPFATKAGCEHDGGTWHSTTAVCMPK
jgi:hypothetical protein